MIGVSLVVAWAVVSSVRQIGPTSGPYRRAVARSFGVVVTPLAAASQSSGKALAKLMAGGAMQDRAAFLGTLATLVSQTRVAARTVDLAVPPEPAGASGCRDALDARAAAGAAIESALVGLLGGPTGAAPVSEPVVTAALEGTGTGLEAADAAWARCRSMLRRGPGTVRVPASTWGADGGSWSGPALSQFVSAVSGSASLAARHDLAVLPGSVGLQPAVVSQSGGAAVLPPTATLEVRVVVANRGNVDERRVVVAVSLEPSGAATASTTASTTASVSVPAGGSVAVDLPPLQMPPGARGTLSLSVVGPAGPGTGTSVPVVLAPEAPPVTTTTTTTVVTTTTRANRP